MNAISNFKHIPILPVGPGTQPEEADGAVLDLPSMPGEMTTFRMPELPEPEAAAAFPAALSALEQVLQALGNGEPAVISLNALDSENRKLVDQTLGEGEVSILADGGRLQIQESVLAGVWRVLQRDDAGQLLADWIEIGAMPACVVSSAFSAAVDAIAPTTGELPPDLQNAPSLVAELNAAIAAGASTEAPHVINLSLLPHTPGDLLWLGERLGSGSVTILSRGYGNCRIVSTQTRDVWWVQYFNSQDQLILNTLEVTPVPLVACAAVEDLEDSRERLAEIIQVLQ